MSCIAVSHRGLALGEWVIKLGSAFTTDRGSPIVSSSKPIKLHELGNWQIDRSASGICSTK